MLQDCWWFTGDEKPHRSASEKLFWRSSQVTELDEYKFHNTSASAYLLPRVLIGSRGEVHPKRRKRKRSAHFWAKDHIRLLQKVIIRGRAPSSNSYTTSVSGKPPYNADLRSHHGKQRFYWPRRRNPPWHTRHETEGNERLTEVIEETNRKLLFPVSKNPHT